MTPDVDTSESKTGKPPTLTFRIKTTQKGEFYWHLQSSNNHVVSGGETYKNKTDCKHAISLVKASRQANVIDEDGKEIFVALLGG